MKRILIIALISLPAGLWAATETMPSDTTIILDKKRIEVNDSGERMKVRVYEIDEKNEKIEDELVFEGHYKDGKSIERRKHSINITLPTWKRGFDPHWGGFGIGFANVSDESLNINDIDGVSLRSGNSLEYNLNVLDKAFPFSKNSNFAVVTGLGMRWSRYRLNTNHHFMEIDGITSLQPASEGITYKSSKLNITSLTIPLLIEWQNRKKNSAEFFFSAGVVGVIKTISSSKVVYRDASGDKHKKKMDGGMNLRPVTMDFLLQAGYDWIGIYAKYSPIEMFESGKGPKLHPVSIGLQLHW